MASACLHDPFSPFYHGMRLYTENVTKWRCQHSKWRKFKPLSLSDISMPSLPLNSPISQLAFKISSYCPAPSSPNPVQTLAPTPTFCHLEESTSLSLFLFAFLMPQWNGYKVNIWWMYSLKANEVKDAFSLSPAIRTRKLVTLHLIMWESHES